MIDHTYWYATRAAGIATYVMLSFSVLWGLALSTRLGDRWLGKPVVYEAHRISSLFTWLFLGVHIASLLGDTYIAWDAKSLLLPFESDYRPTWVSVGVLSAYAVVLLTISFDIRQFIGYRAWRMLHYLSFATFLAATAHGLMTGSDSHEPWMLSVYAAALIGVVFLLNLRIVGGVREVRPPRPAATATTPRAAAEVAQ